MLISCVGCIGMIALANDGLTGMSIARAVARVPLKTGVSREYVAVLLKTQSCQDYFYRETRTVSQPKLNISLIYESPVILPPHKLQEKFKDVFHKVKNWQENLQCAHTKSLKLCSSLSQQAFHLHISV